VFAEPAQARIIRLLPLLQHDWDIFPPYPGNEVEQIPSCHDAGAGEADKNSGSAFTAASILPFSYIFRNVPCQDNLSGHFIGDFHSQDFEMVRKQLGATSIHSIFITRRFCPIMKMYIKIS
jgi:hypothetical protein